MRGEGEPGNEAMCTARGSPTAISRDFICNVTSLSCDILPKSGQDGWCDRRGDGASLGQGYGAVSGGIGYQSVCVVDQ